MSTTDTGSPVLDASDSADILAETPYRALGHLGEGATSEVVEAEHRDLGYRVVVKVLHDSLFLRFDLKRRMLLEAHACTRIRHENLVRVLDVGETPDGRTFIVMEQVHGNSLDHELRRRGALPVPEAITILAQALAGLEAAHQAGLVHRDVKPANLLLCELPDGTRRTKVIDFGYAKIVHAAHDLLSSAPHVPTTAEHMMIGTPYYFSPEQANAERDIDARADLYSAGCVLHELLTGRSPFHDRRLVHDLAAAHLTEPPPLASAVAPQPIPPALDAALQKALAKRRDDRFQTAAAFRAELLRILSG